MPLDRVFKALDVMGLEPASFMRACFGGGSPDLLGWLDDLAGTSRAVAAARCEEAVFAAKAARDLDEKALDSIRRRNPRAVSRELNAVLRDPSRLTVRQAATALGLLASSYRQQDRIQAGARCLATALRLARGSSDDGLELDLMERCPPLFNQWGEHEKALEVTRELVDARLLSGDLRGVGRALVLRGAALSHLRRFSEAVACYRRAPDFESDWLATVAALGGEAFCLLRSGHAVRAGSVVERALGACRQENTAEWYQLLWLSGLVASETGDLDEAEATLSDARQGLMSVAGPIDRALLDLDRIRVALRREDGRAAERMATELMDLLPPLKANPVARDALERVVRALVAGQLRLRLLDESYRILELCRVVCSQRAEKIVRWRRKSR